MAVNISVTFPEPVLEWIDSERGQIKRSTYIIKLLKQTHKNKAADLKKLTKKQGIERAAATTSNIDTNGYNNTQLTVGVDR